MRCRLFLALCLVGLGCGTRGQGSASGAATAADSGVDAASSLPDAASGLRAPEFGPVPALPVLPDDPWTQAKADLGQALFFDKRLSGSGHTSCAACHIPNTVFQDSLPLSTPDRSYPDDSPTLTRNTLSMMNLVYGAAFRWDGSSTDLVGVLAFPLAEPNMNIAGLPRGQTAVAVPPESTDAAALAPAQNALKARLSTDLAGYLPRYANAFGVDAASSDAASLWSLTGRALRAFVAVAVSRDAPFDRWNAGDDAAMSDAAVQGFAVFRGKGKCFYCHTGPLFTDFGFHNLSTSPPGPNGQRADVGRYDVTNDPKDLGSFLTPTLRQGYDTSPYFHDGSAPGLFAVLQHLSSPAVTADPNHDPIFDTPLALDAGDMTNLVAFLQALRGAPIVPPSAPASFP